MCAASKLLLALSLLALLVLAVPGWLAFSKSLARHYEVAGETLTPFLLEVADDSGLNRFDLIHFRKLLTNNFSAENDIQLWSLARRARGFIFASLVSGVVLTVSVHYATSTC